MANVRFDRRPQRINVTATQGATAVNPLHRYEVQHDGFNGTSAVTDPVTLGFSPTSTAQTVTDRVTGNGIALLKDAGQPIQFGPGIEKLSYIAPATKAVDITLIPIF